MFGSTGQQQANEIRRLAGGLWRQVVITWRQTALRTAMLLQGERVDPETLAVTLDGERHLIMGMWSQLAVRAAVIREGAAARREESGRGGGERSPGVAAPRAAPPAELAAAVELCLSRMLEVLSSLRLDLIDAPALDDEQFAFTRTLAEFGRREGVEFADLLVDLLLLREALRRHMTRYPLSARVARGLIDPFLDRAAVSLAQEWSALGELAAAREAEQASCLLTLSSDLLTARDSGGTYQAVVEQARQALKVDLAALWMAATSGGSLELVAATEAGGGLEPQRRMAPEDSVSGEAIRTGGTVTCLDTVAVALRPAGLRRPPEDGQAASAVSAPLIVSAGVVGALEVCTAERRIFEPHEADRLTLLAGQASLVWEHDRLRRRALEQERAGALREIELARTVQSALLSRNVLEVGPFLLGAHLAPSQEVGGDYYDLFPLGEGRAAIHIGDVSGKGIPAALVVAMARYSLRARATAPDGTPAAVLRDTNALFLADLSDETAMFVTACYAVLEPDPPRLVYASAGHHPPMVCRGNMVQVSTANRQAPPLGLARGTEFYDRQLFLRAGDVLAFYTDGVTEARNSRGEWFGLTGLERTLRANAERPPGELATAIVDAVIAHMAGQPLSDDTTVVVLKVGG